MPSRRATDIARVLPFDGTAACASVIHDATDGFAWYEWRNERHTTRLCVTLKGGVVDYADAGDYIGVCLDGSLVILSPRQYLSWVRSNGPT